MNEFLVVLTTAGTKEEAERIGKTLVKESLAACINVIFPLTSIFSWEGRIEQAEEALLLMKTKRTLYEKLETRLKQLHSYQTPEVIALPVIFGSPEYLKWVSEICR
ncbi:MAG: divalent-cation tolerance protein CutA [Thermodesulfobacteriota bacterium]|jgi:periplasmic divalent cation tolerance protein